MSLDELPLDLLEEMDETIAQLTKKEIGIQEFDNRFEKFTMRMNRIDPEESTIDDFNHLYMIVKESYVSKYGS